ncbi:MAG: DUF1616 domain-containing protein [Methanobacterium sp. ERen5]|nr:MAG: DUF1616 domain-containing protein [Methanobacterium sp. ERen5]
MKFDKVASLILLILLAASIVAVIYITVNPQSGEKFTEFYILGENGKAGNYPANLTLGETGNLTMGIVNREQNTTSYDLVVQLNGNQLYNNIFTLTKNETKEIPLSFTTTTIGQNQKMEFMLYKLPNNTNVYRSLTLYINVN